MENWLVGVLMDLIAKSMTCSSNRYINGKSLSLSNRVKMCFLSQAEDLTLLAVHWPCNAYFIILFIITGQVAQLIFPGKINLQVSIIVM